MNYDIFESVSQGSDRAQEEENSRIAALTNELKRLCSVYEAKSGTGKTDVTPLEKEQRTAERIANQSSPAPPCHAENIKMFSTFQVPHRG